MNKIHKCIAFGFVLIYTTVLGQQSCSTPNGKSGHCIPYSDCSYLLKLYKEYEGNFPEHIRNYVIKSRCTGNKPGVHICCETGNPLTTIPPFDNNSNNDNNNINISNSKGFEILNLTRCGDSSIKRVAHGEKTLVAEYPFMALLRYNVPDQPFQCGGSLISNQYVLTAAHCMVGIIPKLIGVRLGEHDISQKEDCQRKGPQRVCAPPIEDYGLEKIIPHEEYVKGYVTNDVALIKLDREVVFNVHIQPVCLPITMASRRQQPEEYFIAGWGTTENGSTSDLLLRAKVKHQERQVCQDIFKRARILEQHICAGGHGPTDSCKGDSGGPLFFFAPYKAVPRYVQYGIVSFGVKPCGNENSYPGIYTNIITFLPWIAKNMN